MTNDPETNFEVFWKIFYQRYPFFDLWSVDWKKQYEIYRPRVYDYTSDEELFVILCEMIAPLHDGHIELEARLGTFGRKARFNPESKPRFYREFTKRQIKALFRTTEETLISHRFARPRKTPAWMLSYGRSPDVGYMRILELEDVRKKKLTTALDHIARDFGRRQGMIIDVRDCPGGDDSTAIDIINRFCDRRRVAFHRRTKIGPGEEDYKPLKTFHIEPRGPSQFTGPVVLLTCDAVFSGGEAFALALRELPHVTIIGEPTNGMFSYQLEKELPNGWEFTLILSEILCGRHGLLRGRGRARRYRASQHRGRSRSRRRSAGRQGARSDRGGVERADQTRWFPGCRFAPALIVGPPRAFKWPPRS